MLRRLSRRLSYANVMSTIAVVVAVGTGSAYAANTVFSTDIVDGEVKSADVGNGEILSADVKDQSLTTFDVSTFLGADIVDGTVTSEDIAPFTIRNQDIDSSAVDSPVVEDGSLRDVDVGENTFINFAADIGIVPGNGCVIKDITGTAAAGDHLLLTPSSADGLGAISYDAIEEPSSDGRFAIKACNATATNLNDGTNHFNLLVFDANGP
jgi:hypothetical protein